MPPEQTLSLGGFRGLNQSVPANFIADNELSICDNLEIGLGGELTRRPGWSVVTSAGFAASQTRLLGHYQTPTLNQLIAWNNGNLYYSSNGTTWTPIGAFANCEYGLQYADLFYVIRSSGAGVLQWNGSVATSIAAAPLSSFGIVHKERLFLSNANTSSSRVYYSDIGNFSSWPGVNFVDVAPGDGDFVVAMIVLSDILYIFKTRSTWALYISGAPANWTLRSVNKELGCISMFGLIQVTNFIYFCSLDGVYRTDGVTFEEISTPIKGTFANRNVSLSFNRDMARRFRDRIVFMFFPTTGEYHYFVYYYKVDGWTRWVTGLRPAFFTEVLTETTIPRGLYAGDHVANGFIYRLNTASYLDNAVTYQSLFQTKDFELDVRQRMKRGKWLAVSLSGAGNHTVDYIVNEVTRAGATFIGGANLAVYKVPGPGYFRRLCIRYQSQSNNALTVYGLDLALHLKREVIGSGV